MSSGITSYGPRTFEGGLEEGYLSWCRQDDVRFRYGWVLVEQNIGQGIRDGGVLGEELFVANELGCALS